MIFSSAFLLLPLTTSLRASKKRAANSAEVGWQDSTDATKWCRKGNLIAYESAPRISLFSSKIERTAAVVETLTKGASQCKIQRIDEVNSKTIPISRAVKVKTVRQRREDQGNNVDKVYQIADLDEQERECVLPSKGCIENPSCASVHAKLLFLPSKNKVCTVRYKGVEFPWAADAMQSAEAIDAKAKKALCMRKDPLEFKVGSYPGYLISNQKIEGCELTLYAVNTSERLVSLSVSYDNLVYSGDSADINFRDTWEKCEKTAHGVDLNWCWVGNKLSFYWEGQPIRAEVIEDTKVTSAQYSTLKDTTCKVKTLEGDPFSIGILQPVSTPCREIAELGSSVWRKEVAVVEDGIGCRFKLDEHTFSVTPVMNEDGTLDTEKSLSAFNLSKSVSAPHRARVQAEGTSTGEAYENEAYDPNSSVERYSSGGEGSGVLSLEEEIAYRNMFPSHF